MGHRNTVFAQLTTFLPRSFFKRVIGLFKGDFRVRRFPCWAQLGSMLHAQFTGSESLRDLETGAPVVSLSSGSLRSSPLHCSRRCFAQC